MKITPEMEYQFFMLLFTVGLCLSCILIVLNHVKVIR